MQVIAFEDSAVTGLGPVVALRPACDLAIGSMTLAEGLAGFGGVTRVLRPHLASYLQSLAGRRVPFWGSYDPSPAPHAHSRHGAVVLVANARLVPGRATMAALRSIVEAGHEGVVRDGRTVLAAILKVSPEPSAAADLAARLAASGDAAGMLQSLAKVDLEPPAGLPLLCLATPADLLDFHEREIESTLALRLDSGRYRTLREGLHVAEGVEVVEPVVVRSSPVVIEAGASIGPFVCFDGPVWIGERTRVNPHAWLRQATAAGRDCRLGGEIEASVLEPFSNKPHHGFLGHSHLGSWVNLAAGTVTSNLKATYGTVRMRDSAGRVEETGRQFVGAFVGDLVRTGINTSIACGSSIFPAASVGGNVSGAVPAFATNLHGGESTTGCEQAATVLARMMARRGLAACEADGRLLADLAAANGYSDR
jgi:glucose-1-phosphate thymidylyltransferase